MISTGEKTERALLAKLEAAEEEIAWLKSELGILRRQDQEAKLSGAFDLTGTEAAFLSTLRSRGGGTVVKDAMMSALYSHRPNSEPEIKIIDVFACKIRSKMRRVLGQNVIGTAWGSGYYLTPDGIAAVDAALASETVQRRPSKRHGRQELAA